MGWVGVSESVGCNYLIFYGGNGNEGFFRIEIDAGGGEAF